jgi:hypothetical protein
MAASNAGDLDPEVKFGMAAVKSALSNVNRLLLTLGTLDNG